MYNILIIILFLFCQIQVEQYKYQFIETKQIEGDYFNLDQFGNLYFINNNTVTKYSNDFVNNKIYTNNFLGRISHIDVNDPLRILIFYQDFNQVVFLDKTLNPLRSPINLDDIGFTNVKLVCSSNLGGFWIFDDQMKQLIYINKDLQIEQQTANIQLITGKPISPLFLTERDQQVFLNTFQTGIFIFNQYGNFIKNIPIKPQKEISLSDSYLYYYQQDSILFYNLKSFEITKQNIPEQFNIINIKLFKDKLYIFSKDKLSIYKIIN